ncbi:MAG TPA: NTP transferase domain-containing protein [Kofleriaceae bacterium]|nr:NTP transferase domain-containing protein [Kofleriaceae bacterium]
MPPEGARRRLGAVVLAAGSGRRLGGVAKALLRDGGETLLARVAALAAGAGVNASDVVVVVGPPFGDEVAAEARRVGATVVVNSAPERGMASSVALGFAALEARDSPDSGVAAAFLWPVDHPRVALATLATLVALGQGVPSHGGRGGHPPLVPRRLFALLAACTERAAGARDILRELPRIPVDDPGVIADIDVPGDLERVCAP